MQILTSNKSAPSRDWLNPSLGYIQTSRSRAKVVTWFKQQNRDSNIADGRALLEDEFRRLSIGDISYKALADKTKFSSTNDMFAAIGAGDLKPTHVAHVAQKILHPKEQQLDLSFDSNKADRKSNESNEDIRIRGVGRLLTTMAHCCHPVPGDAIVGYITVGRGVSIHRQDCMNILQLEDMEPNRIIEVSWGRSPESVYSVSIEVHAYDREGLLRDITTVLANEQVNVTGINTYSDAQENTATLTLVMDINSLDALGRVLTKIKQLPNIIDVRRKRGA